MSNKVKYNLKNVHAAVLTEEVVEGVTEYSYATPKAIPGAVSINLDAEGDSSVVAEHIRRLRAKLAKHGEESHIETVWGMGYKWVT